MSLTKDPLQRLNVAASVAAEARDLLVADVASDIAGIEALVKESKEKLSASKQLKTEEAVTKKYRQLMESKKVDEWIGDLGYVFTELCVRSAHQYGYECPAQYCVANAELCGCDPFDVEFFKGEVRSWVDLKFLAEICPEDEWPMHRDIWDHM